MGFSSNSKLMKDRFPVKVAVKLLKGICTCSVVRVLFRPLSYAAELLGGSAYMGLLATCTL